MRSSVWILSACPRKYGRGSSDSLIFFQNSLSKTLLSNKNSNFAVVLPSPNLHEPTIFNSSKVSVAYPMHAMEGFDSNSSLKVTPLFFFMMPLHLKVSFSIEFEPTGFSFFIEPEPSRVPSLPSSLLKIKVVKAN